MVDVVGDVQQRMGALRDQSAPDVVRAVELTAGKFVRELPEANSPAGDESVVERTWVVQGALIHDVERSVWLGVAARTYLDDLASVPGLPTGSDAEDVASEVRNLTRHSSWPEAMFVRLGDRGFAVLQSVIAGAPNGAAIDEALRSLPGGPKPVLDASGRPIDGASPGPLLHAQAVCWGALLGDMLVHFARQRGEIP